MKKFLTAIIATIMLALPAKAEVRREVVGYWVVALFEDNTCHMYSDGRDGQSRLYLEHDAGDWYYRLDSVRSLKTKSVDFVLPNSSSNFRGNTISEGGSVFGWLTIDQAVSLGAYREFLMRTNDTGEVFVFDSYGMVDAQMFLILCDGVGWKH